VPAHSAFGCRARVAVQVPFGEVNFRRRSLFCHRFERRLWTTIATSNRVSEGRRDFLFVAFRTPRSRHLLLKQDSSLTAR
jgi:hypothetical protein